MGFGFRQAVKAGAPYSGPRSTARINLEQVLKRRPGLRAEAEKRLASGDRADIVLGGLRDSGRDGRFAVELYRDADCGNWVRTDYADDVERLIADAQWGFDRGVYARAWLWALEPPDDGGKEVWAVIRSWPEGTDYFEE